MSIHLAFAQATSAAWHETNNRNNNLINNRNFARSTGGSGRQAALRELPRSGQRNVAAVARAAGASTSPTPGHPVGCVV